VKVFEIFDQNSVVTIETEWMPTSALLPEVTLTFGIPLAVGISVTNAGVAGSS